MNNDELRIRNVRAVLPHRITGPVNVLIRRGIIERIGAEDGDGIDGKGGYLFPGMIDLHVHGGGGSDVLDGTAEAISRTVRAHLAHGTTTLLPTAMSATEEELNEFFRAYREFQANDPFAGAAPGVHLEGPYFSTANAKSKGAQQDSILRPIDLAETERILAAAQGVICRWDAAPELEHSEQFARLLTARSVLCAVAHTDASADEAERGFASGFSHVTHFYNATTAYRKVDQHTEAGVVEAAYLNGKVTLELICDGRHVPKQCLQLALKIKGAENVCAITDATRFAGTALTRGKLGSLKRGADVIVEDGVAKLPDRSSFAGSVCTADRALRVLCADYGVDPVDAAKMMATTPARLLNIDAVRGSVEEGKAADLILTDGQFRLCAVWKDGASIPVQRDEMTERAIEKGEAI